MYEPSRTTKAATRHREPCGGLHRHIANSNLRKTQSSRYNPNNLLYLDCIIMLTEHEDNRLQAQVRPHVSLHFRILFGRADGQQVHAFGSGLRVALTQAFNQTLIH